MIFPLQKSRPCSRVHVLLNLSRIGRIHVFVPPATLLSRCLSFVSPLVILTARSHGSDICLPLQKLTRLRLGTQSDGRAVITRNRAVRSVCTLYPLNHFWRLNPNIDNIISRAMNPLMQTGPQHSTSTPFRPHEMITMIPKDAVYPSTRAKTEKDAYLQCRAAALPILYENLNGRAVNHCQAEEIYVSTLDVATQAQWRSALSVVQQNMNHLRAGRRPIDTLNFQVRAQLMNNLMRRVYWQVIVEELLEESAARLKIRAVDMRILH